MQGVKVSDEMLTEMYYVRRVEGHATIEQVEKILAYMKKHAES